MKTGLMGRGGEEWKGEWMLYSSGELESSATTKMKKGLEQALRLIHRCLRFLGLGDTRDRSTRATVEHSAPVF